MRFFKHGSYFIFASRPRLRPIHAIAKFSAAFPEKFPTPILFGNFHPPALLETGREIRIPNGEIHRHFVKVFERKDAQVLYFALPCIGRGH